MSSTKNMKNIWAAVKYTDGDNEQKSFWSQCCPKCQRRSRLSRKRFSRRTKQQ